MISQPIWIGIVIVVFFIGIGLSYAHFANTYDHCWKISEAQRIV